MSLGKFQIYTGDGKGKTTAAIGLSIRAAGNNYNVYFIQLLKNKKSGEEIIFKNIDNIKFKKFGFKNFIIKNKILKEHIENTNKAIEYIDFILKNKKIDLLILDEFNLIIYYKLISIKKTIEIIDRCKEKKIELIITGRKLNKIIKEKADLITTMKETKHYFKKVKARKGIEF